MATTIGTITLDGSFAADWPANAMIMTAANTVAGYQVYGAFVTDSTLGANYVIGIDATNSTTDPVIAPGTVIYLNTDQNNTTGYTALGAEYEVQFAFDSNNVLQAYLYSVTSAGVVAQLNGGAPLNSGFSSNGQSVELAIPQSLLTPVGGAAPTTIDFGLQISNNATAGPTSTASTTINLPTVFGGSTPEYIIPDAAATAPAATIIAGTITLDGSFSSGEWPTADMVMTPGNTVSGYQVYGAFLTDASLGNTYVIGIDATGSEPQITAGTTIYLNTDLNGATGYSPFGSIGAEYEVQFAYGSNSMLAPFLYSVSSTGGLTPLNGGAPLPFGMSSNGESVELAITQASLTPSGGAAPTSIEFAALNGATGLPLDLTSNPEYLITDSAALVSVNHAVKKVAIVYSATTAALYFGGGPAGQSAYADLFMAAQQQARAAGVSYDLLSESDLTNVAKLSQYSALIFPSFQDVPAAQASAIASALQQVVYQYHVPIITAGGFMTNDQTGAALSGNSYASMQALLNLTPPASPAVAYGTATYSLTPDASALAGNNPILSGFSAGQKIGGASGQFTGTTAGLYTSTGYQVFQGYTGAATPIADINLLNADGTVSSSVAGVVQTNTGGTNTLFATTSLLGDSNLLQHVIENTVFGTTPSLSMDITRFKGVVNSRTDMDQSQFAADVDPVLYDSQPGGTKGIYDVLLNTPVSSVNPADASNLSILAYLAQQYDFVGSYYINVGDGTATSTEGNATNWSVSLPYYDQLLQMGNEIGTHSDTHLINPPTPAITASTATASGPGATQITVTSLPSYNGATLGMVVTDAAGDFGANTIITAYSGNATTGYTLTLQYIPGGYGTPNDGAVNAVAQGTPITFSVPAENTNFLSSTGSGAFTYTYEFAQSAAAENANIGITIAGAAVPGANDYLSTSQQILAQFPSTSGGLTGYVSGGWTGVGSGSPNAIGYITPSNTGSVYIAPNITFDFTEAQFQGKSPDTSLADWESLFNQLSANSETPIIVWPWHDYGITDWPTNGIGTTPPAGYNEQLYQSFIAYAYNAGDEFVTSEDLARRVAAEAAATLSETTSTSAAGVSVISATVTPGATQPDLGAMALNMVNGAAGQVIENAGSWYAYDTTSVFLANAGAVAAPETFNVTLGTTQDDVTHVDYLPMRADLQSATGDGSNLTFAFTGSGTVDVHVKTPGANILSINLSAQGTGASAPAAMLAGENLTLVYNDGPLAISSASPQGVPVLHNVAITEGSTAVVSSGAILFNVSVAYFLANQSLVDGATAINISDSSANVLAHLSGLATDGLNDSHITSITLTDATAPTLSVTVAEALNDATALSKIVSAHTVVLADTAANIAAITSAQAAALKAAGYKTIASTNGAVTMTVAEAQLLLANGIAVTGGALTATDPVAALLTLSAAQVTALIAAGYAVMVLDTAGNVAANLTALQALWTAGEVFTVAVSDSAANVATNLNALQTLAAAGKLTSIALTDGGTPAVTVTIAQAIADTTALSKIIGPHTVVVADTAANIAALTAAQAAALLASGYKSITSTTGAVTVTLAEAQLLAADGISVTGGATVTATIAALLALTAAQGTTLTGAGYKLTAADTAANIQKLTAANVATLLANHVTALTANNNANVALSLTLATALEGAGILVSAPTGKTVTLTDTSANLNSAAFSTTVIQTLKSIGVAGIASSNGAAVTLNVAKSAALATAGLKITGANVTATDTAANLLTLTAAQISTLPTIGVSTVTVATGGNVNPTVAQGVAWGTISSTVQVNIGTNVITDTAANIAALTTTQIAALNNLNSTQIKATDTTVNLTLAQAAALGNDGFSVSAPTGSAVQVSDTTTNLQALSNNAIYALPDSGVTKVVSSSGNVTYSAAQTSDFAALHLLLATTGANTASVTMANNGVVVSSAGSLTLSTNSNSITVSAGASALSVTQGSETVSLSPSSTEAITATGRTKDTFAFTSTFGQDSITGFLTGTASTHDILQFSASAFGTGLTSANPAADLTALLSHTTNNSAGYAVITDLNGDSVTLTGVSKSTLAIAANSVDFKFV